jgi:ABC-type sulfate transport system substrate-binding protein
VLDGLKADVVTFNQVTDIQVLHDQGDLVVADWQSHFPNNSVPYYSLPAFLVRKGNPKNIKGWEDLVRGDVLVTFEAEVQSIGGQFGKDKVDLVIPPVSLRADFPVSVVDKVVDERGSRKIAETYLKYLYTPEAQEIIASHFNRPIDKDVAAKHAKDFADVRLLTVEDVFGGWQKVQTEHLANGAILDQLYVNK